MLVRRFRLLAAAACLTVFAPAWAHQDDAAQSVPPIMDCHHPPKEAVSALPEPVGQWTQLNFFYRSDADIWGVACSGQCKAENMFHVYRSKP